MPIERSFMVILATVLISTNALAGEAQTPSEEVASRVAPSIKEIFPEATVSSSRQYVMINFRTRDYMVYMTDARGNLSTELTKITGPDAHGFSMEVALGGGSYMGSLDRPRKPVFSPDKAQRMLYFYRSVSMLVFGKEDSFMTFNINYGRYADMKKVEKVYEIIAATGKQVLEVEGKGALLRPPDNPTFKITNRPSAPQTEKDAVVPRDEKESK